MELDVYWAQLAEDKLEDIYNYYKLKAGKRIAKKLINGIVDTTIDLHKQPEIGQVEFLLNKRKQEFRYLVLARKRQFLRYSCFENSYLQM